MLYLSTAGEGTIIDYFIGTLLFLFKELKFSLIILAKN